MPVQYRECTPPLDLAPFVECYWMLRGHASEDAPQLNRVTPDGCMDIIFDLSTNESWVIGPMSIPLVVNMTGPVDLLGVRFRPMGLPSFIRLPASELLDTRVDLDEVWATEAASAHDALLDRPSVGARMDVLNGLLRRRRPAARDAVVARAIAAMEASRGALPIGRIVDHLGLGRRQLERLFATHIGLSPKQTARIIRFRRSVQLLAETRYVHWAQFAVECGYYDQAHLIRDFRTLAGITPEKYRLERSQNANVASVQ